MEITLKFPFTNAAGQHIDKVTMRRAKRGDMKAADKHSKDEGEQEDFLFARLIGLTLEDMDRIDLADSKVLVATFQAMVAGGDGAAAAGRGAAEHPAAAAV
ncbi:MAG: phage tail assembly protein [Duganella sp.]